ncbi:hypothetical protein OAE25_00390 [Verrucomicrobiales bacterium]|nr:hypothetical protein [Schleiferiaceae bacterium]MDB4617103.1 hypothetical protein [Verrucomicrobiales bacterium]
MEEKVTKTNFKFPTEVIELPSKGLIYPKDNPLSSGKIEMKYMTAKEEDILTNANYIQKGIVLDKLIESLIVSKINYNDLIVGDKNALLVAARVLGYGKDYEFRAINPTTKQQEDFSVDLSTLKDKNINPKDLKEEGVNEFDFTLPHSKTLVSFKLLSHLDEKSIEREIKGLQKINKESNPQTTTRLKYLITSVDGDREKKTIREFIDTYLLARDARSLREEVRRIAPDVELVYNSDDVEEGIDIPIDTSFFWPDAGI